MNLAGNGPPDHWRIRAHKRKIHFCLHVCIVIAQEEADIGRLITQKSLRIRPVAVETALRLSRIARKPFVIVEKLQRTLAGTYR